MIEYCGPYEVTWGTGGVGVGKNLLFFMIIINVNGPYEVIRGGGGGQELVIFHDDDR